MSLSAALGVVAISDRFDGLAECSLLLLGQRRVGVVQLVGIDNQVVILPSWLENRAHVAADRKAGLVAHVGDHRVQGLVALESQVGAKERARFLFVIC